jgi:hypothetical protein
MLPVATHREASAELIAAALFYEQLVAGLGADFLRRYDDLIAAVRHRPRQWREVKRGIRMTRFPYTVYFELQPDQIQVYAVAPQRRRPFYWLARSVE